MNTHNNEIQAKVDAADRRIARLETVLRQLANMVEPFNVFRCSIGQAMLEEVNAALEDRQPVTHD